MIVFIRLPDSSDVRSELSQTDQASNGVQKYHRPTVLTRFEFLSPQGSHLKINTPGSNDHACHRGCNSRFDEDNQVVHDPRVHNSTCLCFHSSCRFCCCSIEDLDLPADFSRRCSVLPQLLHFALRNRHLAFSCPALPQQAHVDITAPISIGVG